MPKYGGKSVSVGFFVSFYICSDDVNSRDFSKRA